jgi:hypothetical protein
VVVEEVLLLLAAVEQVVIAHLSSESHRGVGTLQNLFYP